MIIENTIKNKIKSVLNKIELGHINKYQFEDDIPFSLAKTCALELGYKQKGEIDECFSTNGWDVDYCYYMLSPSGKTVCINGNLWYGTLKIYKLAD